MSLYRTTRSCVVDCFREKLMRHQNRGPLFILFGLILYVAVLGAGIMHSVKRSNGHFVLRGDTNRTTETVARNCLPTVDDRMSFNEVLNYFQCFDRTSCSLVHDFGGTMMTKDIHYRGLDGQKAICLDPPQLAPSPDRCVVYSFGINDEWSFDEAMERYGCQVFAFDPSMNVSHHNRTDNIHFFRMRLGVEGESNDIRWQPTGTGTGTGTNQTDDSIAVKSLSQIYDDLKEWHAQDAIIDYLKLDIEWAEWRVLPDIVRSGMIDKVRQLAVEVHFPYQPPHFLEGQGIDQFRRLVAILRQVEERGMTRFDSKRNVFFQSEIPHLNYSGPMAYEIAWYNRRFL